MRFTLTTFAILLLSAVAACANGIGELATPTPVVSLLLVEGQSVQQATVSLATPADSLLPDSAVTIPASEVNLRIEDDSGNAFPFLASSSPGRYNIAVRPRAGGRYWLKGTVRDRAVSFETRVPGPGLIKSPAAETLTVADTVPCPGYFGYDACVRLEMHDPALIIDCRTDDGFGFAGLCADGVADGGRLLFIIRSSSVRDLLITGYNGDFTRPRMGEALVIFGAGTTEHRKLYFP